LKKKTSNSAEPKGAKDIRFGHQMENTPLVRSVQNAYVDVLRQHAQGFPAATKRRAASDSLQAGGGPDTLYTPHPGPIDINRSIVGFETKSSKRGYKGPRKAKGSPRVVTIEASDSGTTDIKQLGMHLHEDRPPMLLTTVVADREHGEAHPNIDPAYGVSITSLMSGGRVAQDQGKFKLDVALRSAMELVGGSDPVRHREDSIVEPAKMQLTEVLHRAGGKVTKRMSVYPNFAAAFQKSGLVGVAVHGETFVLKGVNVRKQLSENIDFQDAVLSGFSAVSAGKREGVTKPPRKRAKPGSSMYEKTVFADEHRQMSPRQAKTEGLDVLDIHVLSGANHFKHLIGRDLQLTSQNPIHVRIKPASKAPRKQGKKKKYAWKQGPRGGLYRLSRTGKRVYAP